MSPWWNTWTEPSINIVQTYTFGITTSTGIPCIKHVTRLLTSLPHALLHNLVAFKSSDRAITPKDQPATQPDIVLGRNTHECCIYQPNNTHRYWALANVPVWNSSTRHWKIQFQLKTLVPFLTVLNVLLCTTIRPGVHSTSFWHDTVKPIPLFWYGPSQTHLWGEIRC